MSHGLTNLVVGADSIIGRSLTAHMRALNIPVIATSRRTEAQSNGHIHLDLSESAENWNLPEHVAVAYICAAISRTIPCRRDPAGTAFINVHQTARLTQRLLDRGARVVFLSTNQVFSGKTPFAAIDEPPSPASEYGRQKAQAEKQLLALGDDVTVLRLSKVINPGEPLLSGWADELRRGRIVRPLVDYYVAPLPIDFVLDALLRIGEIGGLFQVSGSKDISYGEVGFHLAKRLGVNANLVQPRTTAESGLELEAFGPHTTMDSSRLLKHTGLSLPDVWSALDMALAPQPAR